MSFTQEAPALIQYSCERCKTRFVLPPSRRSLGLTGKLHAVSMGFGRAIKLHESVGEGFDNARRQLLAKMDDEAYQAFVQSFRFCHECRQFVCNECWSASRRSCLTCADKAMARPSRPRPPFAPPSPDIPRPVISTSSPRRGHLRRDLGLIGLMLAIVLVSIEGGVLLLNGGVGGIGSAPTPPEQTVLLTNSPSASLTAAPTAAPTAGPTQTPAATPTAAATPTPLLTPSATPSATATPTATPSATPTIRVTPRPSAVPPLPASISLTCTNSVDLTVLTCHVTTGGLLPSDRKTWNLKDSNGTALPGHTGSWSGLVAFGSPFSVEVIVSRTGTPSVSSGWTNNWP